MRGARDGRTIAGLALCGLALPALAQTPVEQQREKGPPSAISLESPGVGANKSGGGSLKAGANSFGEGQARDLLESKGFKNVSALMNDQSGIWRGTAMQGDEKVQVSVDYQGRVASTPASDEGKR